MALWTVADVRAVAPEFVAPGTPDVTVQFWIDKCDPQVAEAVFADNYNLAGCFLTAHYLTLFAPVAGVSQVVGGPVSGMTAGSVSVQFAATALAGSTFERSSLGRTKYGLEYVRLIDLAGPTPEVC